MRKPLERTGTLCSGPLSSARWARHFFAGASTKFQAEAFRYQGTYEWFIGREGQADRWWQKSLEIAKEIEQPYEEAMTILEMGQRQAKPELIKKANVLLAEIGARPDLRA